MACCTPGWLHLAHYIYQYGLTQYSECMYSSRYSPYTYIHTYVCTTPDWESILLPHWLHQIGSVFSFYNGYTRLGEYSPSILATPDWERILLLYWQHQIGSVFSLYISYTRLGEYSPWPPYKWQPHPRVYFGVESMGHGNLLFCTDYLQ